MRVSSLRLYDFRNYRNHHLSFEEGIHVIAGKNAQGKTNLLEAILYLSTTRSHRTSNEKNLIREGCEAFFLQAELMKHQKKQELKATVNEKGKNLFVYGNPVSRVSDFIGELNAVMFCPDDMNLFHASPRVRRRFVDVELSKVSKKYVSTLYKAGKLLKERNAYLRSERIDENFLTILSEQLIDQQIIIMKQRYHFLQELLSYSLPFYQRLSQDGTTLAILYDSCVPYSDDEKQLRSALQQKFTKYLQRDMQTKQTSVGIHKEDFSFQINGKDIETYASQGQKRSVLLALKIGMIHMISKLIKDYPVLLLDDVFSELDVFRREQLLTSLPEEVQIFISTTDISEAKKISNVRKVTLWKVDDGNIVRC